MKKILAFVLAAIFVLLVMTACGKTEDKKSDDAADYGLLTDGTLTIGSEIGYPPFEQFAEDGVTPIGFDVDMANEIGARLGLKINFINTKFDTIAEGLGVKTDFQEVPWESILVGVDTNVFDIA